MPRGCSLLNGVLILSVRGHIGGKGTVPNGSPHSPKAFLLSMLIYFFRPTVPNVLSPVPVAIRLLSFFFSYVAAAAAHARQRPVA